MKHKQKSTVAQVRNIVLCMSNTESVNQPIHCWLKQWRWPWYALDRSAWGRLCFWEPGGYFKRQLSPLQNVDKHMPFNFPVIILQSTNLPWKHCPGSLQCKVTITEPLITRLPPCMYACQCVRECAYLCCQAVPASAGQQGLRNNKKKWTPWMARLPPNYKRCFFWRHVLKIGCTLLLLQIEIFFEWNKNQYTSWKCQGKKRCTTYCISASQHNLYMVFLSVFCFLFYFEHVFFSTHCERNKMENRIRRVHI